MPTTKPVAICERMIANGARGISGSQVDNIGGFGIGQDVLRPRQRGLQQAVVPQACGSTVQCEQALMQCERCSAIDPDGILHFARVRSVLR